VQGQGGVSLAGWRAASQPNDPVVFSETNGTDGVTFTYRSIGNSYPESGAKPANPGAYIVKAIFPAVQNYESFTAESEFTISNRDAEPLEVIWTEQTEFVYNKMVQVPMPSVKNKNGENIPLMVINGQSAAGEYKGALSALEMIRDEWSRQFYYLTNNTIDYEIKKKTLDIVMTDKSGNRIDSIVVDKNAIQDTSALLDYIESIIDYGGFATDTVKNETDNANVLSGSPCVNILNQNGNANTNGCGKGSNPRSLRELRALPNGEFVVLITTDEILADNYYVKEREIRVYIGDDGISFATPISKVKKSDNRHGIRFTQTIVSDKAEISIILPNSEKSAETKITIYDMTGNIVFVGANLRVCPLIWDLRNTTGRNVANGTYLVIAEVKSASGQRYHYSAKLGVKR
jgi:membrane-bound inhibitor of C-type lysozyme